jgi:hypothetical protein
MAPVAPPNPQAKAFLAALQARGGLQAPGGPANSGQPMAAPPKPAPAPAPMPPPTPQQWGQPPNPFAQAMASRAPISGAPFQAPRVVPPTPQQSWMGNPGQSQQNPQRQR